MILQNNYNFGGHSPVPNVIKLFFVLTVIEITSKGIALLIVLQNYAK
jgi:hypothetical protein